MKNLLLSKSAAALIACLSLAALAGCGANRNAASEEAAVQTAPETQSTALSYEATPAIEIDEVLNYHFGVHG